MKVATYYNNQDIRIEEREVPSIGEGELLVKIRAAGICGSDVTEWYRTGKVGRVLGHEIGGEIVAVGAGVKDFKEGDRISASHHVPCYQCHFCKLGHHTLCDTLRKTNFDPGGFAEFIRLSPLNVRYGVYRLGGDVTFDEGTFVEPLACVVRAQRKANAREGQTVLVMGSGIAGLLHILLAKASGLSPVIATDLVDYRLKMAKEFGADYVFSSSEDLLSAIPKINEGRLPDLVILCAGAVSVAKEALQIVERGGTILFFALPKNPEEALSISLNEIFWKRGVTLMNSYAASPEDHRESLKLIQSGKIDVKRMISHRLPFDQVKKGFELVTKAQDSLKVIIDPTL